MAYLIFNKDQENEQGSIIYIAANDTDRDNLNILLSDAKVIDIDTQTFQDVQLSKKIPESYSGNNVTYVNKDVLDDDGRKLNGFKDKVALQNYIDSFIERINTFLDADANHADYSRWNSYKSQLENLNLDGITYPLDKSLEQHFSENSQTVLHPLQIP